MAERNSRDVGAEEAISRFLPGVKPEAMHLTADQHEEIRKSAARSAFETEQSRQVSSREFTESLEFRITF